MMRCVPIIAPRQLGNPRLTELSTSSCGLAKHTMGGTIICRILKHTSLTYSPADDLPLLKWFSSDQRLPGIVNFHREMAMHFFMDKDVLISIVHGYMCRPSWVQVSMKVPLDTQDFVHHNLISQVAMMFHSHQ